MQDMQPAQAVEADAADPADWAEGQLEPAGAAPNSPGAASVGDEGTTDQDDTVDVTDDAVKDKASTSTPAGTGKIESTCTSTYTSAACHITLSKQEALAHLEFTFEQCLMAHDLLLILQVVVLTGVTMLEV